MRGRAIFIFDVQTELPQQGKIDIYLGIFGGEKFVAKENGIGTGKKTKRLAFARNPGASGREPDPRFG